MRSPARCTLLLASLGLTVPALAQEEPYPAPYSYPAPETPGPEPEAPPPPNDEGYADNDPSALTAFRDALDPYGAWVNDPAYGLVWVPSPNSTGPDFQPYVTGGHWAYESTGWTWVSDYPWGWAPFHFGRWVQTPGEGWAWIPGRRYSGAWVDWRVGNGYVGWAPAPPEWAWRNGEAVRLRARVTQPYTFSTREHLFAPTLSRSVVREPALLTRTAPYAGSGPRAPGHGGPPPSALGIPANRVVRAPRHDEGLQRAIEHARPATTPRTTTATPQHEVPGEPGPRPRQQPAETRRGVTAPQSAPPRATAAPEPHATAPPRAPPQHASPPAAPQPAHSPPPAPQPAHSAPRGTHSTTSPGSRENGAR